MASRLGKIQVGEALVVPFTTDEDITGATIAARVSLNGATASEYAGTLGASVGGEITSGTVTVPGTFFTAAGFAVGVVVVTKAAADWSPMKDKFEVQIEDVP